MSDSKYRATKKYSDKTYDKTLILSKKGIKDLWKAEAEKRNLSLNAFIINAVENYIKKEREENAE